MKWIYRILFAACFLLLGAHLGAQYVLHELSPVIEQSMQILRGDHRAMMVGDYEAMKGIHEGKNKKSSKVLKKGKRK